MKNFAEIKYVPKGWGYEKWIVNKDEYCGKILWFSKGKKCSWHYHKIKDEVFYIQSGKILLKYGISDDISESKEVILNPGDNFHIHVGASRWLAQGDPAGRPYVNCKNLCKTCIPFS